MRAHYFQHVPFEGLGSIERWLTQAEADISVTRFFAGDALPSVSDVDFLVVMGGPMSVNDEVAYPWLIEEKAFIRSYLQNGKPLLGICLGAQMIASALGAKVYANPVKEIGWFQIFGKGEGDDFRVSEEVTVFHWHGETFELPPGARLLASSADCKHQAFQIGRRVIGLQFHLETTHDSLDAIIENCREELVGGEKIMSEAEMRGLAAQQIQAINRQMDRLLDFLAG